MAYERKDSHEQNHPAKLLKSAWIQTHRTKSKWKAEKRREGIQSTETPSTVPELEIPVSDAPDLPGKKSDQRSELADIPSRSESQSGKVSNPQTTRERLHTTKTGLAVGSSQHKDHRSGRHDNQWCPSGHQRKKPSMRSRMNALLEKIQKEID